MKYVWVCALFMMGCATVENGPAPEKVDAASAKAFMERAESELLKLSMESEQAAWVNANFITQDTEAIAARAEGARSKAIVAYAKEATKYDGLDLEPVLARKFKLIKSLATMPVPEDAALADELSQITSKMVGMYGSGSYTRPSDAKKLSLGELSQILATSRNPNELKEAWVGWRKISIPIRDHFTRYVELINQGAQGLGYKDNGEMWCSKYDMDPKDFQAEMDRLWDQVKPLYLSLHAYVRMKLREHYGADVVPETGPIPAHLLGNMWSQTWSNIYPLVAPKDGDPGYDLTELLKKQDMNAVKMVRVGEQFFTSMGFDPLPGTFWDRSLFVKPEDRDVVCHASAWDLDWEDDLRIKMCINVNAEDFVTIHHELGHNFYQRAYKEQPFLFRDSANDGFHEAVGDTLALSITPKYLVDLGYLGKEPDTSKDIGLLLNLALDKIAFLPFGLLIDQWRWKVFSGEVSAEEYNKSWWELRQKYQGIAPPVERTEADFDPAAKYHVAANVSYARYFLAHILQFQFHRALAKEAGAEGPLNRASIYGSKQAGDSLNAMLEMGSSRPWPEALEAMTGESKMDAGAIIDYFQPLKEWLDKEIEGQPVGW